MAAFMKDPTGNLAKAAYYSKGLSLAAGLCDPAELSRPVVRQPPRLDLELDRSPHRYFGPQLGSVYRHMKHRTRAGRPGFGNDDLVLSNLDPNSAQTHLLLQLSEIEDGQVQRLTTELLSPKAPKDFFGNCSLSLSELTFGKHTFKLLVSMSVERSTHDN
jgi:hypothetical protein